MCEPTLYYINRRFGDTNDLISSLGSCCVFLLFWSPSKRWDPIEEPRGEARLPLQPIDHHTTLNGWRYQRHHEASGTTNKKRAPCFFPLGLCSSSSSILLWISVSTTFFWFFFQSVLYLKNGIDRYWRKTAPNAIPLQEKEDIKTRILQIYVQRLGILT